MRQIARFVFTGGIGFIADAAALVLLLAATPLHPSVARLFSIAFALSVTWLLNRHLTFGPSTRTLVVEGARYGGVGIGSSILNYLVYSAILFIAPGTLPLIALALASIGAMTFSWFGYSRLVFDR